MGNSMKKITLLLVIIFTFLFTNTSWGEWTYVEEDVTSKTYYDKDRVRKSGKCLYFWILYDFIKPTEYGDSSQTTYTELDCSIFRFKTLKLNLYSEYMGKGTPTFESNLPDKWSYPQPNSSVEILYNKICEKHQ